MKKEVENMFCFHPVCLFDQFFLVHVSCNLCVHLFTCSSVDWNKERKRFFEITYKKTDK